MATITPGNRLYLYQLLSRELGLRRQTSLARVEEALRADGIWPEDVGCADTRALMEALPEFVKLTVFKKGVVYATVLEHEEYDRALERLSSEKDGGGTANGKPWKRRRGAKALKPVKPRHVEKAPDPAPAAAPSPAAAEPPLPARRSPDGSLAARPAEGEARQRPGTEVETAAEEAEENSDSPETTSAPEPEAQPQAQQPEPTPEATTPSISLTITYVPEPETEAAPEPAPAPEPARPSRPAARGARTDLPQDFHADVRCPDAQLSMLYQLLPPDVDPLAALEEDFRVARSTGSLGGTRSSVTFALRYLRANGSGHATVTLRRSARATGGKSWTLAEVDGGTPEEAGLSGLAEVEGPFVKAERRFAQTVALGDGRQALGQLAELAAPEDWGAERHVLRSYLALTFAHAQAAGLVAATADGAHACFDTGLLTTVGEPLYARLSSGNQDIPWKLEGFSTTGDAPAARYVTSLAQMTLDPALAVEDSPAVRRARRNPRVATSALDPATGKTCVLLPSEDDASALMLHPRADEGRYEVAGTLGLADAYVCARVVSAEQPAWLAAGLAESE